MATAGFLFALGVDTVRTGGDKRVGPPVWQGAHTSRTGGVVPFVVVFEMSLSSATHPRCSTRSLETIPKTSHTSVLLIHPHGQTSGEVLLRVRLHQKTNRNIVITISLSYITSFIQHKNRSLTMITIFLNVNIQYLLHFQINLFLIYFVIISPLKKNRKIKSAGTDESDNRFV